jgi:hypothetical protein
MRAVSVTVQHVIALTGVWVQHPLLRWQVLAAQTQRAALHMTAAATSLPRPGRRTEPLVLTANVRGGGGRCNGYGDVSEVR